jgi:hypothetical protein
MPSVDINLADVLVAAVINMIIGAIWYSPVLFAKQWSKLVGRKMEDLQKSAGPGYAVAAIGALIQAYVLAHFVQYAGATSVGEGLVTGLWLWIGFVAVTTAMNYMFAGRSWQLWQIDAGYFLVVLMINGALLATWV